MRLPLFVFVRKKLLFFLYFRQKSLRDFNGLAILNADEDAVLGILYAHALQVEVNGLAILRLDAGDTGGHISSNSLSFRLHAILHCINAIFLTRLCQCELIVSKGDITVIVVFCSRLSSCYLLSIHLHAVFNIESQSNRILLRTNSPSAINYVDLNAILNSRSRKFGSYRSNIQLV